MRKPEIIDPISKFRIANELKKCRKEASIEISESSNTRGKGTTVSFTIAQKHQFYEKQTQRTNVRNCENWLNTLANENNLT